MTKHLSINIVDYAARGLISLVVLFWVGFVLLDGTSHLIEQDNIPGTIGGMLFFLVPLLTIGLMIWKWPMIGGVISLFAGILAACYLNHPAPQTMMAAPLILSGSAMIIAGLWKRKSPAGGNEARSE